MELVLVPITNPHPNRHAEFISAALTNTIHEPTNPKVLHWIEPSPWAP